MMKNYKLLLLLTSFLCGTILHSQVQRDLNITQSSKVIDDTNLFQVNMGVNISCWVSQVKNRPGNVKTEDYFKESDVRQLAKWGFDHIRLPVDESELFTMNGEFVPSTLHLIHSAISWCKNNNMRVILDLHIIRSHYFNDQKNMTLWNTPSEQDKLVDMWIKLSREFRKYPESLLAYELLNEPVPPTPDVWNRLSSRLIAEVRKREKTRILIYGGGEHNSVKSLQDLKVPVGDPNLMLAFHFYTPHLLTHYKAPWMRLRDLDIPLHYPDTLVKQQNIDTLTNKIHKDIVLHFNGVYNKQVLQQRMDIALQKSKETGLKLYCSEFGCISFTDTGIKERWFTDVVSIFKEHSIAGAVWGYKANFGILNEDGTPKDINVMNILTH